MSNASSFRLEAWDEQEKYGTTSLSTGEAPVLRYVDLSISNTCNNKCRMCVPALSTHWYSDAKKLGLEIPKGIIRGVGKLPSIKFAGPVIIFSPAINFNFFALMKK